MSHLEDLIRETLADPARGIAAPADPLAWVGVRARRRRSSRLVAAVSALATTVAVVGIVVVSHHAAPPSTLAGGLLDWPVRGDGGTDPALRVAAERTWRAAAADPDRLPAGRVPAPATRLRVLWAGSPGGPSSGPGVVTPRIVVVEAVAEDGRPWLVEVAEVGYGNNYQWQLEEAAPIPGGRTQAVLLQPGEPNGASFRPGPWTSWRVLTAPEIDAVEVIAPQGYGQTPRYQALPVHDGLTDEIGSGASQARLGVRLGMGGSVVFEGVEPCPTPDSVYSRHSPFPIVVPIRVTQADWPAVGATVPEAILRADAASFAQLECVTTVGIAPLWSGVADGTPVRFVEFAANGLTQVALATADGIQKRRPRPDGLRGVNLVAARLHRPNGPSVLIVIGRPGVARMVYRNGSEVLSEVTGRVLVLSLQSGQFSQPRVIAYDTAGRVVASEDKVALVAGTHE